jgi:NADH dehydrogenase
MPIAGVPAPLPHVVIIGGGFGGLYAARSLAQAPVRVTVIDRQNYHLFQPLLYQVATAALSPADIATPIRSILAKQENATTLLAEAVDIDLERQEVVLDDGRVAFDYLILATGARHSYFGHGEWESLAPGLKEIDDALSMRRRIFLSFEAAEREQDPERRAALLSFVVVGGGPTGVELAGALGEITRETLTHDFRSIDPAQARIYLVDSGPRVLRSYPERLSQSAQEQLEKRGVTVLTGNTVAAIDSNGVSLQSGERIAAHTVLWAAGVVASPLGRALGVPLDNAGRVRVNPDLSVPGHPNIFVAGDLAALADKKGEQLPGVAQVAIQGGKSIAANIERAVQRRSTEPFHYRDYGSMATIGRNAAVAQVGHIELTGFFAWMAWVMIHLVWLIGFRNRIFVMLQWGWVYLSHKRGARLITMVDHNAGIIPYRRWSRAIRSDDTQLDATG